MGGGGGMGRGGGGQPEEGEESKWLHNTCCLRFPMLGNRWPKVSAKWHHPGPGWGGAGGLGPWVA